MRKVFDRPIIIQKRDEKSEKWKDSFTLHARINKTKADNEYLAGGAVRDKESLTFEVRYFKALEDIARNGSMYRILYRGIPYNINGYDDFMLLHKTVKLLGVSY